MYLKLKQHSFFFILIWRFSKVFQKFKKSTNNVTVLLWLHTISYHSLHTIFYHSLIKHSRVVIAYFDLSPKYDENRQSMKKLKFKDLKLSNKQ